MAIFLGGIIINKKLLGVNKLNKIMLGVIEIFPNLGGSTVPWDPSKLFENGEQGAWYDFSDIATMFQDSAGTTPVTAVGQPVGKVMDKSGRGNHLTQATASKRPLYQPSGGLHWLLFDGVDDSLSTTQPIDFSGLTTITSFIGYYPSPQIECLAYELGTSYGQAGQTHLTSGTGTFGTQCSLGNGGGSYVIETNYVVAWVPLVDTFQYDYRTQFEADRVEVRRNGVEIEGTGSSAGDNSNGSFNGTHRLFVGSRTDTAVFYNGSMNQLIFVGRTPTAGEITNTEQFIAERTGVILP